VFRHGLIVSNQNFFWQEASELCALALFRSGCVPAAAYVCVTAAGKGLGNFVV
jgi:hypothetical protein